MNSYGIRDKMQSFLSNYLTNHNQYTQCNGIELKVNPIYCGVPQGSRLGPLFFSMYINDLPLHTKFLVNLFADDTVLILKLKTYSFYYTRVQILEIALWPTENGLMAHSLETSALRPY